MFEYNARTEVINGAKFIEKDIILFDYSYTGDVLFRTDVNLVTSGFGFIIAEDDGKDIALSPSIYLIKINSNDSYHIFLKSGDEQFTLDNGFFLSATRVYEDKNVTLFFRKKREKLTVHKALRQEDGRYEEILLIEYRLPHDIENYKIGIYSNGGNTVNYASISTEAPSNWITNVFNANGGRIKWIKNGFIIDEAEYDIEVEAENIEMPAGTYYFDYKTTNPDIKAYVYESYLKDTNTKRSRDEIMRTRLDEEKNILQENGSFTLAEDHAINIKFKGKWGTVTEICVKESKYDNFVETGYNSVYREPGRLVFDLTQVASVRIKATVESVPEQDLTEDWIYHLFQRGDDTIVLSQDIQLGKEILYEFTTATGILLADSNQLAILSNGDILFAFYNVIASIRELILVTKDGREINVLLQKTFRTTISGDITSPILTTFKDGTPLELASSYRKVAETERYTEAFHAYNPIKLKYYPDLAAANIILYGIRSNTNLYNEDGTFTDNKVRINYTPTKEELLNKTVRLSSDIKLQYRWILVEYTAIKNTKYIYTPWERELFDLEKDEQIYLEKELLDVSGNIIVYGIPNKESINLDLLYYVPNESGMNLIDLCSYEYVEIPSSKYRVTNAGKIIFEEDTIADYKYIVVDYLKKDVYVLNQRDSYWEIEISSKANDFTVLYDSEDGMVTVPFSVLYLEDMKNVIDIEEGDFVVLEAES